MNSSEPAAYSNDLVRDVFSNLSIDKTRLSCSGLTSIGVPSFVAEWLLDEIVQCLCAERALESQKFEFKQP